MTSIESDAGLGAVLKRGAVLAAIGLVVCQVVSVVQMAVLGRLLGPDEVGIFLAGSVTTGVLLVVAHGALSQALIQREDDLEDAANTVLVVTVATGLFLSLAVLAASPLIGKLFHSSEVGLIAAATSGVLFVRACSSVPDALMQRGFQFKRRIIIDPLVALTVAGVSIVFAILGYGAWAMVIGTYASAVVGVVLSWWLAKWRPFRGRVSFRIWRELAGFSSPLLFDGMAERGREVFEQVIVGRSLGTADLAQYKYAYRIASLPSLAVISICGYVLYPAFARIAGDPVRFRAAFLRALGWIWFAALPAGALLVVVGQPIVVLLLGEEWRAAGGAATAMVGVGLGTALTSVCWEAIKGAGRSSLLNWITVLALCMGPGLILLLVPFGLVGIGVAISATYLAMACVSLGLARSAIGVTYRELVACLAPTTSAALVATAVVLPAEHFLIRSDQYSAPVGLASVIAVCLAFMVIYLGTLRLVSPSRYRSIRELAGRSATRLRDRTKRLMSEKVAE